MKEYQKPVGDTLLFGSLVLLIGSIIRMGASIYLPAMPVIGKSLHISRDEMSSTLTVYFVIFASFILVSGSMSDAHGRRPVLLSGMFTFFIGSVICAMSHDLAGLMAGRIVQALGASMIPGTLMAMIRDACSDMRMISLTGWLSVLGGLLLVTAPVLGGILTNYIGWEANFWFLSLFSAGIFTIAMFSIPETHPVDRRVPARISTTLRLVRDMLASPAFMMVMLPVIACFTIQGAYLASSPYILMTQYGMTPLTFGACNIIMVAGLFAGRWAGSVIYMKKGGKAVYEYSGIMAIAVSLVFLVIGPGATGGLYAFLSAVGVFASVLGALLPVGMKSALTSFRAHSGIAASMQGALLLGSSALGSGAAGMMMHLNQDTDTLNIFSIIAACCCLAAGTIALKSHPV